MTSAKKIPAKVALENALIDLLRKKTFQKISVNELCEAAGVSRSAFYANFQDKYQLLAHCFQEKMTELDELTKDRAPKDFLMDMLNFVQKHSSFFFHTFGGSANEEMRQILYQFYNQHFTGILEKRTAQGLELPGPVEAVSSFYVGGMTTLLLFWIKSGYKVPKEELAGCLYALLKDVL